MRFLPSAVVAAVALIPGSRLAAAAGDAIISETAAEQHGLVRPWLAQAELDPSRARVCDMVLYEGALYVESTRANVTALDAETGQRLWARTIGNPDFPSMPLAVGGDFLAVLNGSELYVANRYSGEVLYEVKTAGSPNGPPALSDRFAFVPTAAGSILAYRLEPLALGFKELPGTKKDLSDEEKQVAEAARRADLRLRQDMIHPVVCQSNGKPFVQPLVTKQNREEERIAWPTDRGALSVARIDHQDMTVMSLQYEVKTDAAILAKLAYRLPNPDPKVRGDAGIIFATSINGYVYAVSERRGDMLWKFPTSGPVYQPPALVEDHVYVVTQLGGLFCCDSTCGTQLWSAPDIVQFVAASKQRVYAADRLGRIQVLNAKTGALLDMLPTELLPRKLLNAQTDRLYLATDTGMVQCLHEIEQTQPLVHDLSRMLKSEEAEKAAAVKKVKTQPDQDHPRPKATPKKAAAEKPAKKAAPAKTAKGKKAAKDADSGN
jgi:outer membrane protein assembly factor BamB